MRERPILFSAPMVRAIIAGTKTQTRRVVKMQPRDRADIGMLGAGMPFIRNPDPKGQNVRCPYGQPGDRLWVRETFALECSVEGRDQPLPYNDARPVLYAPENDLEGVCPGWTTVHYRATDPAPDLTCERESCAQCRDHDMGPHWRPSIHMPRWASRIDLEVIGVRVERLQDIGEDDCFAEAPPLLDYPWPPGSYGVTEGGRQRAFQKLWESINGAGSWHVNPWVWVVEFKRVQNAEAS